jgi:regulator of nonsense transcripts 2
MSTAQKSEEESARYTRRLALKALNLSKPANGTVVCCPVFPPRISRLAWYEATELILVSSTGSSKSLDSSLKRHNAFIKKIRQSVGAENRDQLLKDIETLSLEKHVDELDGAVLEGISKCKSEKDVWSAVEVRLCPPSCCLWSISRKTGVVGSQVISAVHRRFPKSFTPSAVISLSAALGAPSRASLASLPPEQREKEDTARVAKQRPILRVCSELALVGIIRDAPDRSGGEWIMKVLKELVRFVAAWSRLLL